VRRLSRRCSGTTARQLQGGAGSTRPMGRRRTGLGGGGGGEPKLSKGWRQLRMRYKVFFCFFTEVLAVRRGGTDVRVRRTTYESRPLNKTSRLPVRCDGSQEYSRKLSTKKISRFFIGCLHSLHNIFYERMCTICSKPETPIPRFPHFQGFVEREGKGRGGHTCSLPE
jgi:hypothetical protein